MCGIIGYTGARQAAPILLAGLERLAYRGYDSAGIAVAEGSCLLRCRAEGKIPALLEAYRGGAAMSGTAGIGHTRWATHGAPLLHNAHPHVSTDGRVALVHNGIIENDRSLRAELEASGCVFTSETDTEAIVHLLAQYLRENGNPAEALKLTIARLTGSFALAVLFAQEPQAVYAVRRESPLLIGTGTDGQYLASDVPALLPLTRRIWEPPRDCIVRLAPDGITLPLSPTVPTFTKVTWEADAAERAGYDTFMEKEIGEIPTVVARTAASKEALLPPHIAGGVTGAVFIGCGSAYHVGLAAACFGEELTALPVRVCVASEFRYRRIPLAPTDLVVAVSQSGETADTLAAVREAKRRGAYVLAIVNVVGSSIAREADRVFYTSAGPEIAVATTKAFCAQLVAVYRLFGELAAARGGREHAAFLQKALATVSLAVRRVLAMHDEIRTMAARLRNAESAFFIGRGADHPACLEGSLKLKEVSYLHAEAYPAGELKHGTISLITDSVPVIALSTCAALSEKLRTGIEEVRARGAEVLLFCDERWSQALPAQQCFPLPHIEESLMPILSAVALELLALDVATLRGLDPDTPRNLAKSVTVE